MRKKDNDNNASEFNMVSILFINITVNVIYYNEGTNVRNKI